MPQRCRDPADLLTFLQHAHFQTLHEAARLTRLASPFGDLALVGGRTAVLDVTWRNTERRDSVRPEITPAKQANAGELYNTALHPSKPSKEHSINHFIYKIIFYSI